MRDIQTADAKVSTTTFYLRVFVFPCPVDHEQDWQSYPVDPYSAEYADHSYL